MKNSNWLILINLVILLGVMAFQITKKEDTLANGELVFLKLAPVDPRSLMQGDYMTLRYAETRTSYRDSIPARGYFIVTLDSNRVATKVRFQQAPVPLHSGEYRIKYFWSKWSASIGAESYFFEEGTGERFEAAEYGALRVHESGESLLIGLYDKDLNYIEP